MKKKISLNFIAKSLTILTEVIYSVFCFPIIANRLGVMAVGEVDYYTGLASYFATLITFGTTEYGIRESRRANIDKNIQRNIFTFITSIKALIFIPAIVIYLTLFRYYLSSNSDLFHLTILVLITSAINSSWYLESREEYSFVSIVRFITKAIMFILIILFVKSPSGAARFLSLSVGMELVFALVLFIKSLKMVGGFQFVKLESLRISNILSKVSWTFMLGVINTLMTNFCITYLGRGGNYDEAGKFSIANRVFWAAFYVTIPITSVLFVRSMEERENKREYYNKVYQVKNLLISSVVVGLFMTSEEIIKNMFGMEFIGSIPVLKNLSLLIFVFVLSNFWSMQILYARNKEKLIFVVTVIGLLTMIILFLANQKVNALDASRIMLISYTAMYIIFRQQGLKYFKPKLFSKENIKAWSAATIMALIIYNYNASNRLELLFKILLGAVVYIILIIIFKHELSIPLIERLSWKKRKY